MSFWSGPPPPPLESHFLVLREGVGGGWGGGTVFWQSLALLRAGHNPCQRREMAVSTNNGLVNGPVHNLLMQFFTLDSSKIKVFETCFYDIVTTQYDHLRYLKHVLGRIYVFFTLFGY